MSKVRFLATASVASLIALAAGSASAATVVTFTGYQFGLNSGETLVTNFDGAPIGLAPGYTAGGNASLLTGTSGEGAAPAFSPVLDDTTQYLSVKGGQFFTLSTPSIREISFYIGSLDAYNTISFTGAGGFSQSFTGTQLTAATAAFDMANGNQTAGNTNGRYTFAFDQNVNGVRLDSTSNSFEVSNIGAIAGVPEPGSWALMILGFGGVGAVLRSKRRLPGHAAA